MVKDRDRNEREGREREESKNVVNTMRHALSRTQLILGCVLRAFKVSLCCTFRVYFCFVSLLDSKQKIDHFRSHLQANHNNNKKYQLRTVSYAKTNQ